MSYEPEKSIKKFQALENSRGQTLELVAVLTDDSIWYSDGEDWVEWNPIPGTPRHRELSVSDGLPEDEP